MAVNLKRYGLVYLACIAALVVLSAALKVGLGISLPSGLSMVLPTLMAAMFEGQKAADAEAVPYTGPEAWAQARRMTAAILLINAVFLVGALLVPEIRALVLSMPIIMAVLLIGALGVVLLVNRFGLTWGFNNRRKVKPKNSGTGG